METTLFQRYESDHITDEMLQGAAQVFSNNYGVWSEEATKHVGPFARPGSRVKMSRDRLRAECLPAHAECSYVRVTVDGYLAGHAFACRWKYGNKNICWITQLVVDRNYRERGLATGLLTTLRRDNDTVYGIASSHAAACLAAAKAFGRSIDNIKPAFIHDCGEAIMKASPIRYIKEARPRGSLFDPGVTDGTISCVDTGFFVDHTEPLEALQRVREDAGWPLGNLVDGHEFVLILKAKYRRSRT